MAAGTVRCPICKKEVALNDPNMPFCSDRCRLIDLGNWASEKYVISTPQALNELEAHKPPGAAPEERETAADLSVRGESVVRGSSIDGASEPEAPESRER